MISKFIKSYHCLPEDARQFKMYFIYIMRYFLVIKNVRSQPYQVQTLFGIFYLIGICFYQSLVDRNASNVENH